MSNSDSVYTLQQLTKLRGYYGSLIAQQRILDEIPRTTPDPLLGARPAVVFRPQFQVLQNEINEIQHHFSGLLPSLIEYQLAANPSSGDYPQTFDARALRAYVGAAAARIAAVIETATGSSPVTERLDFSSLRDAKLREILERDYDEAQRAYISQCWKSVVILTGGALEGLLLDSLLKDEPRAASAKSAPKNRDVNKWDLSELIKVSVELGLVEPVVETLANAVRQYRNLVHPGAELRSTLKVEKLEADSGLTVLRTVCRDLA